jgi:predicted transcriptional regulator
VADVMDDQPVTLPGEVKLDRALDEYFVRYGWDWFPVTDVSGRFLGLITRDAAEHVPEALRQGTSVAQAMAADTESTYRIGADEPLENLLGSEGLRRLGAMMAVDREGVLRGVVTVDQVRRALQPATVA